MNDLFKRILDFIETTGKTLIKAGFELTVRQVIVENAIWLATTLLVLVISLIIFLSYKKKYDLYQTGKNLDETKYANLTENEKKAVDFYNQTDRDFIDISLIISGGVLSLFSVILLLFGPGFLIALLNPQWAALEKIINLIK